MQGEPSRQSEDRLSPEGLGGHHLLSQTKPCRPGGEVMRHHLGGEPGSGPRSVNRPAGRAGTAALDTSPVADEAGRFAANAA